jgi:predicted glycosyltransferase involved in capsule biosynthesis
MDDWDFFKSDFINMGGYDEDIIGYGHDDRDMFDRAMALGFKIGRFEGNVYINRLHHARADRVKYMLEKNRRAMEERNRAISMKKLKDGMLVANVDKNWGSATLLKNFRETITQ